MVAPQHPLLARSLLFVPGDSDKKLAKCESVEADALILDLEDSVAPGNKPLARERVVEFLTRERAPLRTVWVRINALGSEDCGKDLASVVPARPTGIVLPKPRGAEETIALAGLLDGLERRFAIEAGATKILPIATETAASVLALGGYASCGPRLAALTWGAEDLSVAVGAAKNVDEHGEWLPLFQLARSLCLLAAAAAGVAAIDTVHTDFRDTRGLVRQAIAARRDGFSGKLAIHPEQVEVINRAFEPDAEEIAHARRVIAAFADAGHAGVVALDGLMLDRPHLTRAHRTLGVAAALEKRRALATSS